MNGSKGKEERYQGCDLVLGVFSQKRVVIHSYKSSLLTGRKKVRYPASEVSM